MPLKDWGFTNYGQIREVSVRNLYTFNGTNHFDNETEAIEYLKGTFEWLTGRAYNDDGGTKRALNAFSKVATNRNEIYQKDYASFTMHLYLFTAYINYELRDKGNRLRRHIYLSMDGEKVYQTPAFLMQDLAYLASKGDYEKQYGSYPIVGNNVSKKYESAKNSFIRTSGFGGNVPIFGGMAHPHLPQTYYLIAKNNFVALK